MVFSHATTHKDTIMDEIDDLKLASKQSHPNCSLELSYEWWEKPHKW